jgi:hypothetical protein
MPQNDPLRWHKRAVGGEKPPIHTEPECGYFLIKTQAGMLPVSIFWHGERDEFGDLIEDEKLCAELAGAAREPDDVWPICAKRPISKEEYLERLWALLAGEERESP